MRTANTACAVLNTWSNNWERILKLTRKRAQRPGWWPWRVKRLIVTPCSTHEENVNTVVVCSRHCFDDLMRTEMDTTRTRHREDVGQGEKASTTFLTYTAFHKHSAEISQKSKTRTVHTRSGPPVSQPVSYNCTRRPHRSHWQQIQHCTRTVQKQHKKVSELSSTLLVDNEYLQLALVTHIHHVLNKFCTAHRQRRNNFLNKVSHPTPSRWLTFLSHSHSLHTSDSFLIDAIPHMQRFLKAKRDEKLT